MSTVAVARRAGPGELPRSWVGAFAAALSLSSAIAHFSVAGPHYREWWGQGVFFLVCGVAQATFATLILWRPRGWLALTGVAGNLAIVCMYVYSRTNGSPNRPARGRAGGGRRLRPDDHRRRARPRRPADRHGQ